MVEGDEADRMKGYLQLFAPEGGSGFPDVEDVDALSHSGQGRNLGSMSNAGTLDQQQLSASVAGGNSVDQLAKSSAFQDPTLDWNKVGRVYKANEQLESILEREMSRLKIVMDKRIAAQDIELEEKALVARGKKK